MKSSTDHLIIRALQIEDLKDFHQYRSNPEVTKYQGFDVMTVEEAEKFIFQNSKKKYGKPGEWVQYAIAKKDTNQLLGDCAIQLKGQDHRIAEMGITISHLHQKQGYAKEAIKGILVFLFEEKGLHRVIARFGEDNIASMKVLESLNFRREGYFLENVFFKGAWDSEYQYAMLRKEWFTLQAK